MSTTILRDLGPACRDATRRGLITSNPGLGLNGIDFVEYRERGVAPQHVLEVHFLLPLPAGAYGLPGTLADIRVEGGTRIVNVQARAAIVDPLRNNVLNIEVDRQGDFSTYVLALGWRRQSDGSWRFNLPGIDRQFSVSPVNFRPGCPVDFDCLVPEDCPPEPLSEPRLDYLAKDYASFRRLLLDLVAQRHAGWIERNPADLGIALLELFAHEGDHLSYFQDAVANEAYLDTARLRVSTKRHARLVDYTMHDGRNAWAFVHFTVSADGLMPPGQLLLTRVELPLRNQTAAPPPIIPAPVADDLDRDPALARVRVFETATSLRGRVASNEIRLHTWGNQRCCLPRSTTSAHLYAVRNQVAERPDIQVGDYLLLEELRGPETGAAADADPAHRQVVRIVRTDPTLVDLVYSDTLAGDVLQPRGAGNALPLLEVVWREADALTFPLCLSSTLADGTIVEGVSQARGNLVLADHGHTVGETLLPLGAPLPAGPYLRPRLARAPLTQHRLPADVDAANLHYDPMTGRLSDERPDLGGNACTARPAVSLQVRNAAGLLERWAAVPDLLASGEFDQHFVADVERDGRATLRFGDGEYGRRIAGATEVVAWYRVGNGPDGNVGAEALFHLVLPPGGQAGWPTLSGLRNPLPAAGGAEAETTEQVRQYAPAAFRARQFRAVTTEDYREAALTIPGVAGAAAAFRWTGSWHTVFVGIDPRRPEDLITEPGGRTRLEPAFEQRVRAWLTRFRLAGYDLELRAARYVPLRIELALCVLPGYFRGEVAHAVAEALSSRLARGGRPGFFSPDRFTFGQPVYLSHLYADVEAVEGVDSVTVSVFQRFGQDPRGELQSGVLTVGLWEIPRLDNDPNRLENGVLVITAAGGK